MNDNRSNFVEWLKAVGMGLIVYGHTNGHAIFNPTLPVNLKQIGVVFFLISTGYLLANERRPAFGVLINRFFNLYFYGLLIVVSLSVVAYLQIGDLNESNYLPFAFGANVLINAFPANPSLWYIGTYIHLLLIWAVLLRSLRITPWMILVTALIEIGIRAWLMDPAGDFIAYQLFTNWLSIFMLGIYLGRESYADRLEDGLGVKLGYIVTLAVFVAAWVSFSRAVGISESNPVGRIPSESALAELLFSSVAVSVVYFTWGILGFQIFRRFRAGAVVAFLGRNSMLCFMLHMPLIYAFSDEIKAMLGGAPNEVVLLVMNLAIFYVGVCAFSELLTRTISASAFRVWLFQLLPSR